jgi:hypothetical protein
MKLSKSVIVAAPLALILATAAPARADLTGEAKDVEDALFELLSDTDNYKESVSPDGRSRGQIRGSFQQAPVDCAALVEQGVKAGIAPGDKLRGYPDPYLFKRAPELVCAEYTKWRLLGRSRGAALWSAAKITGSCGRWSRATSPARGRWRTT